MKHHTRREKQSYRCKKIFDNYARRTKAIDRKPMAPGMIMAMMESVMAMPKGISHKQMDAIIKRRANK